MRIITFSILLVPLILFSVQDSAESWPDHSKSGHYRSGRPKPVPLPKRVAQLEAQVEALTTALQEVQEILQYVHVETEPIDGLSGPHWIISGANVHVRSGSGNTFDSCGPNSPNYPNCESLLGRGNLIVGYNERFPRRGSFTEVRTGSHNLVVGEFHSYSSFGGFVAGSSNKVTGTNASVCGGTDSEASGDFSSVSGGHHNLASGLVSSVSGGQLRSAESDFNWAAGSLLESK